MMKGGYTRQLPGAAYRWLGLSLSALFWLLSAHDRALADSSIKKFNGRWGDTAYELKNKYLRVEVVPAFGGRITGLTFKPTGSQELCQKGIPGELPDTEPLVADVKEAMGQLFIPDRPPGKWGWNDWPTPLGRDRLGASIHRQCSIWGWLEVVADPWLGPNQGNEQHCTRWDHRVERSGRTARLMLTYRTELPPAALLLEKEIMLDPDKALCVVQWTIRNTGKEDVSFCYMSHANSTPGGAIGEEDTCMLAVPGKDGKPEIIGIPAASYGFQRMTHPAERWVAFGDREKGVLKLTECDFPLQDMWLWRGGACMAAEPIHYIELAPEESTSFGIASGVCLFPNTLSLKTGHIFHGLSLDKDRPRVGDEIVFKSTFGCLGKEKGLKADIRLVGPAAENVLHRFLHEASAVAPDKPSTREFAWDTARQKAGEYCLDVRIARMDKDLAAERKTFRLLSSSEAGSVCRVLLVGSKPREHMLSVSGAEITTVPNLMRITPELLSEEPFDLVWISSGSIGELEDEQVEAILRHVRDGGGLVVDPEFLLFPARLPMKSAWRRLLDALPAAYESYNQFRPAVPQQYEFGISEKTVPHYLTSGLHWPSATFRLFHLLKPNKGAQTLLTLDHGPPALVVREFGKGRMVMTAMGLDPYFRGWRYAGEEFEEFVRRIVSWVSRKQ